MQSHQPEPLPTPDVIVRRYTFKLYPTRQQIAALERQCALHAWLWNAALQERIDCYRLTGKSLSYYDQGRHIKTIRADDPEYAAMSQGSLERTLQSLDLAFKAFYRRAKQGAGAASGFPRYKASAKHDVIPFRDGTGWRMKLQASVNWRVYVKGLVGDVKARGKFPVAPTEIRTMEILRRDGGWWMSVVAKMPIRRMAGHDSVTIDFDLIDEFATVEVAKGGCPAFVSFDAGSENLSPNQGHPQPSPDGELGLGSDGRRKEACPGAGLPDGELGLGSDGRMRVRLRSGARPDGELGLGSDGRGRAPDRFTIAPDGELGLGSDGRNRAPYQAPTWPDGELSLGTDGRRPANWLDVMGPDGELGLGVSGKDNLIHAIANGPTDGAGVDLLKSSRDRRFKRGSRRWRMENRRAARLSARIARQRRETLHLWTTAIIRQAASVAVTYPKIAEVVKTGRGNERRWGAAVKTVASVNRAILSQAPMSAIQMLEYKAAEAGVSFCAIELDAHHARIGQEISQVAKSERKARRKIKQES